MASSPLPLLFLLLLATASISSAMETTEEELAPSPYAPLQWQEEKINWGKIIPWLKPKPRPAAPAPKRKGGIDVDFSECWQSIASVAGCRVKFELARIMNIRVGKECCNSMTKVGEYCFSALGEWLVPLLKDQCK